MIAKNPKSTEPAKNANIIDSTKKNPAQTVASEKAKQIERRTKTITGAEEPAESKATKNRERQVVVPKTKINSNSTNSLPKESKQFPVVEVFKTTSQESTSNNVPQQAKQANVLNTKQNPTAPTAVREQSANKKTTDSVQEKQAAIESAKKPMVAETKPLDPFAAVVSDCLTPQKETTEAIKSKQAAVPAPTTAVPKSAFEQPSQTTPADKPSESMSKQPERNPLPVAPSPAYANSFQPKSQNSEQEATAFHSNDVSPTSFAPSWESLDAVLLRPIMYETPKAVAPLPSVSAGETLPSLESLKSNDAIKRLPAE